MDFFGIQYYLYVRLITRPAASVKVEQTLDHKSPLNEQKGKITILYKIGQDFLDRQYFQGEETLFSKNCIFSVISVW